MSKEKSHRKAADQVYAGTNPDGSHEFVPVPADKVEEIAAMPKGERLDALKASSAWDKDTLAYTVELRSDCPLPPQATVSAIVMVGSERSTQVGVAHDFVETDGRKTCRAEFDLAAWEQVWSTPEPWEFRVREFDIVGPA